MAGRAAGWLAGLMIATAIALLVLRGDFSSPTPAVALGGVAVGVGAIMLRMSRWFPFPGDSDAKLAGGRLRWIWWRTGGA